MTYNIRGSVSIEQALYLGLLTTVQRTALIPTQEGAIVYDTDEKVAYQWNGTTWVQVGSTSFTVWAPATAYTAGQVLTQGGRIISRISAGTSGLTYDATEAANYTLIQTAPMTVWAANAYYYAGELVRINERTVRRLANGISGATFDVTEGPLWSKVSDDGGYYSFVAGKYYYIGDKVATGSRKVSRLLAGIGGATFDATEAALWQLVETIDTTVWAASTYYYSGEQAISPAGTLMRRLAGGASGATFDLTEAGSWSSISVTKAFPWVASRTYFAQDWVITPSGNLAQNASTRVSGATFDATEAAFWSIRMVGNLLPSWAAATWYYSGDQVQVNGVQYTRVANGTSGATFDATEKTNWRITAELTVSGDVSTQTKTSSYTVAATDGVVSVDPAANMVITLPLALPNDKEFHFAGAINAFTVTMTAGAGTTIVDPTTYLPVASFVIPGTVGQRYYLSLRKVGTVWCIT